MAVIKVESTLELIQQLEAAKQRELELLAVIERFRDYIKDRGHDRDCEWHKDRVKDGATYCNCGLNDAIYTEPSQALREYEAKVIEPYEDAWDDLLEDMELRGMHKFEPYIKSKANFRRMAEERRKK